MKKLLIIALLSASMTGCVSMKYNGAESEITQIDYPVKDQIVTAYIGEHLVEKRDYHYQYGITNPQKY